MPTVLDRVLLQRLFSPLTRSNCSNPRRHREWEADLLARFDCTSWQDLQSPSPLRFPSPSKVELRCRPLVGS